MRPAPSQPDVQVVGTNQFTPRQVLEAGRRAEADGKLDYAIQFFQHVMTHHGGSPEAAVAHEALWRLDGNYRDSGTSNGAASGGYAAPRHQPLVHVAAATNGSHSSHLVDPSTGQRSAQRSGKPGTLKQRLPSVPESALERRPTADAASSRGRGRVKTTESSSLARMSPRPVGKRYRFGRVLARLLFTVGSIGAIGGSISLAASIAIWAAKPAVFPFAWLAISPILAGSLVAVALFLLLTSQMAGAIFDAAQTAGQTQTTNEEDWAD